MNEFILINEIMLVLLTVYHPSTKKYKKKNKKTQKI